MIIVLTISVMMMVLFAGCGTNAGRMADDKINIVCTIFPQYDWVREIVGDSDSVEVTLLIKSGTDLHSYQPTADDIITISTADIFIYVGGVSDAWVDNALKQAENPDIKIVNMLDVLGDSLKEEEIAEGMEDEHEEHDSETEYDEHVWLSVKNAIVLCSSITDTICEADEENRSIYESNSSEYIEKLRKLDSDYKNVVENAKYDTILFGDRFPFVYLTEDYDIKYYAAFAGCSAETEASFETVAFLAEKLNELKLPAVITVDASDKALAETIISSTKAKNQAILVMNSMQSVTEADIEAGMTYFDIMRDNLEVLGEALVSE